MNKQRRALAWTTAGSALLLLLLDSNVLAQGLKPGALQGKSQQVGLDAKRVRSQVESLQRENDALSSKMSQLETRVNKLLSQSGQATRQKASDWNQFRADVLKVMDSEIQKLHDELDQLRAFEEEYRRHNHEYVAAGGGYANFETLQGCPACLIKFRNSGESSTSKRQTTSKPK